MSALSHPLVTIAIPVYNAAQFLRATLESASRQTYGDLEILVSDNASTDETADILDEHAAREPRMRVIRRSTNGGFVANFNGVLEQARGTLFRWLAGDDVLHPQLVERAVERMAAEPDAVTVTQRTAFIDACGEVTRHDEYLLPLDRATPSGRLEAFLRADRRRGYAAHEIFGTHRTDVLRQCGGHGDSSAGDWVTIARLLLHGRIVLLPDVLFYNREHPARSLGEAGRTRRPGSRLSHWIGGGPRPASEWFDPRKQGRIVFPDWDILAEYVRAVHEADLTPRERRRCVALLARHTAVRSPRLARDVLVAGEQAARLIAAGHNPARGGLDRL